MGHPLFTGVSYNSSPLCDIHRRRHNLVGMTGFEPATSSSRTKRTTKLCYIPLRFVVRIKYTAILFLSQLFFLKEIKKEADALANASEFYFIVSWMFFTN